MKRVKLFFIFLLGLTNSIFSQAGHIDTTFNPTDHGYGGEASATIYAVCLQPDGKILIGGDFTVYNGVTRIRLARLNVDGSTDYSFNIGTGVSGIVHTIVCQSDGKILIGGNFSYYNGTSRRSIARINSDGSLDTSFNPGSGFDSGGNLGTVYAIAIQNDGKIIVGGEFIDFNGIALRRMARLNTDGSFDPTFNSGGVGPGPAGTQNNGSVQNITIFPDGKMLVTGDFKTYNNITRNRMARVNYDGTLDTTLDPGTGAGTSTSVGAGIKTIAVQSDGKILIGGGFTTYNGISRRCIARINADATLDTSFNPGTGITTNLASTDRVNKILIQSDGKIVLVGNMYTYNGNAINHITRINADGSFDPTFTPGAGATSIIKKAVQQSDGKIIIVGSFTQYNSISKNRITRLNLDGTSDPTFNTSTGFDGSVHHVAIQNDGKILVGGSFTICNETPQKNITRLTADGNLDTSFNVDGVGTDGFVSNVSIQNDGKIIIAGNFTSYNVFYTRNNIARLNVDGTLDYTFSSGIGSNGTISDSYIQSDGKIIVIGSFTTYNNISRIKIARLNTNGSLDSTFDPVTSLSSGANIYAIATQNDGKFILVGSFTSFNGTTANRIVRLNADGSQDTSFNTGAGANDNIHSVCILQDGKILIGGVFTSFDGTASYRIARLNSDGSIDSNFYSPTGVTDVTINNFLVQTNGKIIISGSLLTFDGVPVNNIARLNSNGTVDTTFYVSAALELINSPDLIMTTAFQADGKLIIGGIFTSYGGVGRNRLARLFTSAPAGGNSIINLKLFIQAYYLGNNTMTPVQYNQGIINTPLDVQTVTVELRHSTTFALVATSNAIVKTDGTAICSFPSSPNGSYYIAIKGSNFIETWSASPVMVGATPLDYDFTTLVNKAYGDNMIQLEPGVFGFYSGDINQDGNIDTIDYPLWEIDSNNFASGVFATDLNGDGNVDTIDYPIWENNAVNFISIITPQQ